MQPTGWCFDIEADNLYIYAKQVWMVYLRDLSNTSKELAVYPFRDKQAGQKIKDWNSEYEKPFIVGHNILGFDIFILLIFLGIEHTVGKDTFDGKPCIYVDTLYMSMFTNPDRDGHSLARWGERLGSAKIDFHDFSQYTQEMDVYCRQDVNLNVKLFWHLWEEFTSYYDVKGEMPQHYRSGPPQRAPRLAFARHPGRSRLRPFGLPAAAAKAMISPAADPFSASLGQARWGERTQR